MGYVDEWSPGGTWVRSVLQCDRCRLPLQVIGETEEETEIINERVRYGPHDYCRPCAGLWA